ncbi:cell surface protein [Methanosarcina siciliae HI350]|uniref:Cell surface protein n=1 Tax=Methanosarcina siciliae HI350 TaxID=1434119 RepID=A0A0E3LBG6_9EURY|nr:PKD domain-containing protein [Methanosarcina siciliae]AKB33736.1 cell surface protein [Methanosarcina siciliae HI350]
MKRIFLILCIVALLCMTSLAAPALAETHSDSQASATQLMNVHIPFVQNQGQQPEAVKFYADTFYGTAYITDTDLTHSVAVTKDNVTCGVALKEQFVTADGTVISLTPQGEYPAETKVSYFLGNDSSKWQTGLSTYKIVSLGELYPGITVIAKAHGNNVEKLFSVAPGADPNNIRVKVLGADSIHVADDGSLVITTDDSNVTMAAPKAYQDGNSVKVIYHVLDNETYGFSMGEYDRSRTLLIDPFINYSTYFGGNDSEIVYGIKVDGKGNIHITGGTYSKDFPTTAGAYKTTNGGYYDVFVSKFDTAGNLVYSTYLGGNGGYITASEYGLGIAVDSAGDAYITGKTLSPDFPTTTGAYQTTKPYSTSFRCCAFVSKINSTGSLTYSTYLGGDGNDDEYGTGIAVDSSGNAYITGYTPRYGGNFPTTTGAYMETRAGNRDAFVTKLNPDGTALVYSTYLGGSSNDYGQKIAVDDEGSAYVTGYAKSGFPTTVGAYQITHGGGTYDAFVTKLNPEGTGLVYSTFLGGSDYELSYALTIDGTGNACITGSTSSSDFPTTSGAYQTTYGGGSYDAYVTKLNPEGTGLIYSTYLGGNGSADYGYEITTDSMGYAYITGYTNSADFPVTPGAYQTNSGGGSYDAFVTKLDPDGTCILSTYLGGTDSDYGYGIAMDSSGNAYVAGSTSSTNFPVTTDAYQIAMSGESDAFITKLNFTSPVAEFTADINYGDAPLTVNFTDQSTESPSSWAWDFDNDGTIDSTDQNPSYTYSIPDVYAVKLTVYNSGGSDSETKTEYITVTTPEPPVANFTADYIMGGAPMTVQFTDQSTGIVTGWAWDFDNDGATDSTVQNPSYIYTAVGNYTVRLKVSNYGGSDEEVKTDYIISLPDTEPPTVTANPAGGNITSATQVALLTTDNLDPNPVIYYTTNGDDPTTASTRYAGAITITNSTVLKFIAVDASGNASPMQTETYTLEDMEAPNVTASPAGGTITVSTQVILSATDNADPDPSIYYTTDGSDPTTNSTQYTGAINITESTVLKFVAVDTSGNVSPVKTETYTFADMEAPAVTASLNSGNYYPARSVTLSATDNVDSNPSIYYTTDGSDPTTNSTLYTGPITMADYATTTLKFFAVDASGNVATVQIRNYTSYTGDYYTGGRFYTGNDLETGAYQEGNIAVKYSQGDSGYKSGGGWYSTTVHWTNTDLPIPADATVKEARLYQSYTWNNPGNPDFSLQFNGNTVNQTAFYGDGTDNFNGQGIFDVTPYFNKNSNTAIINASNPGVGIGGLYGAVLVVIYEDADEPYRMIWIDEGCDSLYNADGISTDPYVAYAMFNNVTTENFVSSKMTTFLPSGADNSQSNILFNKRSVPIKGSGGGDPAYKWYDVTGTLQNGTNELGVSCDGYMNLASAILEVTRETASEANFSANTTSGHAPLTVKFTDISTGTPTSWAWNFGDGENSTEQNPTHIYTTEGTCNVTLTVSNSLGRDSEVKTGYITVGSIVLAPIAELSSDVTSGTAPLSVRFTDESTNIPTSWAWDFGDGKSSTEQNPSHTYETLGTYTVKLTASNYGGSNTTTRTDYISVTSDVSAPVANFTIDADSGQVPFTVNFTDTSTGSVSSWNWEFGNGSTSTEQNPTHTYVTEGSYNVNLTVTGPGGSDTATLPIAVLTPLTANSYNGGIPLTTVQRGTVSGELWYDSYYSMETSAQKTFTLPSYTDIKWAKLYVDVYDGHMQNNYRGNVSIGIDSNGDSTYELRKQETFDTAYSFPGEGGTGPVWLSDHMNRVTSDYLMWYDLTDEINGQTVNVQATTTKTDSSFDGRVKAITLVVAYDDGDSDQVYYWVNQGHDTVNPLDTEYTGSTLFGTSSLASGWSSAKLTAIYLASKDGIYTFNGTILASGVASGPYYGANTWDISSLLIPGQDSVLAYDKQGSNYYKMPLALMSIGYSSASPILPDAAFAADITNGTAPLNVNFTDQSTGTPTSWLWDFGDGATSTEQSPVHTYTAEGNYSVKLTVTNASGSDDELKTDYITVTSEGASLPWQDPCESLDSWTCTNCGLFDTPVYEGNYSIGCNPGQLSGYNIYTSSERTIYIPEGAKTLRFDALSLSTNYVYSSWVKVFLDGDEKLSLPVILNNKDWKHYEIDLTGIEPGEHTFKIGSYMEYWWGNAGFYIDNIWVIADEEVLSTVTVSPAEAELEAGDNLTFSAQASTQYGERLTDTVFTWFSSDGSVGTVDNDGIFTALSAGTVTVNATADGVTGSATVSVGSSTPPAPVAAFSANVTSGEVPLTIQFADESTGEEIISWMWDFENDGVVDSTEQNPSYIYNAAGNYTVNLTVTNDAGSDDEIKTDYITVVMSPVPEADFSTNTTSGSAPLTVEFSDASTNSPTSWAWDFGDNETSSEQNPEHTYSAAGNYTVNLTVTNAGGSDSEVKIGYITVSEFSTPEPEPVAAFTANVTSGSAPLTVNFTDQSTGSPTSWLWDFDNDGNVDSEEQNPSHEYTVEGAYTVTLTATNAYGNDTETKTGYITVTNPNRFTNSGFETGDFTGWTTGSTTSISTSKIHSGVYGTHLDMSGTQDTNFVQQSVDLTNVESFSFWGYGESTTRTYYVYIDDVLVAQPAATSNVWTQYTIPTNYSGVHTVAVKWIGSYSFGADIDDFSTNYVYANFTATPTLGIAPLAVQFTDNSTGSPTSWFWDFGDGATSNESSPMHTYSAAGNYTVNLTVENAAGSDFESKSDYIEVSEISGSTVSLYFDPESSSVSENESTEISVVASNFPAGLSGYNLTVSIDDPAIAEIVDIEYPSWALITQNSTLPATSIYMKTVDLEDAVQEGAADVVLATLTVSGKEKGSANLSIGVKRLEEDSGDSIEPVLLAGTIEVTLLSPLHDQEYAPKDLDGDGLYEDLTGNGEFSFVDIVAYFHNMDWIEENMPVEYFDFNGNGRIDFDDVVDMFAMI